MHAAEHVHTAEHRRERRPKLVRHGSQEERLPGLGLSERQADGLFVIQEETAHSSTQVDAETHTHTRTRKHTHPPTYIHNTPRNQFASQPALSRRDSRPHGMEWDADAPVLSRVRRTLLSPSRERRDRPRCFPKSPTRCHPSHRSHRCSRSCRYRCSCGCSCLCCCCCCCCCHHRRHSWPCPMMLSAAASRVFWSW